jgi:hypothetical protein
MSLKVTDVMDDFTVTVFNDDMSDKMPLIIIIIFENSYQRK